MDKIKYNVNVFTNSKDNSNVVKLFNQKLLNVILLLEKNNKLPTLEN